MYMQFPTVSILFAIYNGGRNPIDCIKSIYKLNYPKNKLEIIVADNNSTDGSTEKIKKLFSKVTLLHQKKNLGFAKAINICIKKSKGEYLFVTNDDIIFTKDSLKTLVLYAQNNKFSAIYGGKQIVLKTKKFLAGGRSFSFLTGKQQFAKSPNKPVICDQVDGCAMLIPRNLIAKIGYFDEGFFPAYFEDLDFCLRAKNLSIPTIYIPKAVFIHKHAQTISKFPKSEVYFIGFKNKLRLLLKHSTPLQLLAFFLIHYLITVPARTIIKKEPILIPELRAIIWNITNLKKTLTARKKVY